MTDPIRPGDEGYIRCNAYSTSPCSAEPTSVLVAATNSEGKTLANAELTGFPVGAWVPRKPKREPIIAFRVNGIPIPGGSKKAFPFKGKDGRLHVSVTDDAGIKNRDWKRWIALCAKSFKPDTLLACALQVEFRFYMPRTKGHKGTGRNEGKLRPSAPKHHTVKPDALKLARAAEDALTGVIYDDDASTTKIIASKSYADGCQPGVEIIITELEN